MLHLSICYTDLNIQATLVCTASRLSKALRSICLALLFGALDITCMFWNRAFLWVLLDFTKQFCKNETPIQFLGNNLLLSLKHWPLWLARTRWPCPIPLHRHFSQWREKTGPPIRDSQIGRSWWQTVSCPSSLMRPLYLGHSLGIWTARRCQYQ